jgi:aminopeptidase N
MERPRHAPFAALNRRALLVLLALLGLGACLTGWLQTASARENRKPAAAPAAATAPPLLYPPAGLVRLDNPSRSAILRHEIQAFLSPDTHLLTATDRVTLVHPPAVPAEQPVSFLLWKTLSVTAMWGEETPVRYEDVEGMNPRSFWKRPPYDRLDDFSKAREIRLFLQTAPAWPETLHFTVTYSGVVMDSLRPPQAAYARSFDTTDGLITTQGAYLAGSTYWVLTRPDEVFTFSLRADLPAGWRSVSQGGLSAADPETGTGQQRTDIWECPHPMDEVYLVAGPWKMHSKSLNGVEAETFTYANTDSSIVNRYLNGTEDYLKLYGRLIGPYPFEKFALVENFWQTGFGMPSFTLLGDRVIRLPFILYTSYGHEILHNWWGNSVFVDTDSGNWCEGLTTYGADYLYKVRESAEAARQYRLGALSGYLDYVSGKEDFPLSRFRERHDFATQAIGYSKSMMVIHQLHRAAGDSLFWESLRRFYRDNLWRRASWGDLLKSFQQTAGIDREAFLNNWILRSGAPVLSLSAVERERAGDAWKVQATLEQKPPAGAAPGDDAPYPLLVPVRLLWAGGGDSTWQVAMPDRQTHWSARVTKEPKALQVDPDFEMMRRIDPSEIPPTLSRVLGSDTVSVLIAKDLPAPLARAYRSLAQEWGRGQALKVVEEASLPKLPWTPPGSAWYLGLGPSAGERLRGLSEAGRTGGGWRIAGKDYPGSATVLVTGSLGTGGRAWALVLAPDSAQVAVVGAKIPHYGKYSYLVFEGGKNTGQGVWTQIDSPLAVDLTRSRSGK